jgi:hypothetical protein
VFGEATACSDRGAAAASEIVAIGTGDAFDDTELAKAGELAGEGRWRALSEKWSEVGTAKAGDVEAGTLQRREQIPVRRS